ncbi:MAG: IPT/TIG domain-containing protein [Bryobacterales bacterium]|nr:IPT/TIG domain-containing protein [Bryobacterales bacterium]
MSPQTVVICAGPALLEQPCTPALRQFVIHTNPASGTGSATFEFDWTAPENDVGPVDFFAAGNAANGNGSNTGDRIYSTTARLTPEAAGPRPTISQNGVVNGASFQPGLAPASWVTIVGTGLASSQELWDDAIIGGQLPESLGGVRVTVNGRPGFIRFLSPTQINFQSPSDVAVGPVTVQVTRDGVASEAVTANLASVQPAFFLWQSRYAVATDHPGGRFRAPAGIFPGITTLPVRPGDILILWATGLGTTDPPMPAGQVVPSDGTFRRVAGQVRVRIGGTEAAVISAVLSPTFVSLYQVAITVPETVSDGDQPVVVEVDGVSSPGEVFLFIQR